MPVGHLAMPPGGLLGFFAAGIERAPRSIRRQPAAACGQDVSQVIDEERRFAMFDTDLPTLAGPANRAPNRPANHAPADPARRYAGTHSRCRPALYLPCRPAPTHYLGGPY